MILSASRRSDIPALYGQWFLQRLIDGYALTRNPINRQLYRIELAPNLVDCIVFWTKNAAPLMPYLKAIDERGYPYLFQYTLNAYAADIEPGLGDKGAILESFVQLSERLGKQKLLWRYDPIIIEGHYSALWHEKAFARACEMLAAHARQVTISFVDPYRKNDMNRPAQLDMLKLAASLGSIAKSYNLPIYACCEGAELAAYGILPGACIDKAVIESILGQKLKIAPDRSQRSGCRCVQSVDIGAYDTCIHGCTYCYACNGVATIQKNRALYSPDNPLLCGQVYEGEQILKRELDTNIIY